MQELNQQRRRMSQHQRVHLLQNEPHRNHLYFRKFLNKFFSLKYIQSMYEDVGSDLNIVLDQTEACRHLNRILMV